MRLNQIVRGVIASSLASGLAIAILGAGSAAAEAQGFFQQLFGGAGLSAPPPPQQSITPGGRPYVMPNAAATPRRSTSGDADDDRPSKGNNFKTVCVRMCDGYFFPVSNSTTRKGFFRDQMKCRATCGEDARLFHLPALSSDIDHASDAQGRNYGQLSIAYRYRKTLVPGCQCRPAPWSEAEAARHQRYADADADKTAAERAAAVRVVLAEAQAEQKTANKSDEPAEQASAKNAATASASDRVTPPADQASLAATDPVAPSRTKPNRIAANAKPRAASSAKAASQSRPASPLIAYAPKPAAQTAMGLGAGGMAWPGDAPKR